jgi:hypothetical protein
MHISLRINDSVSFSLPSIYFRISPYVVPVEQNSRLLLMRTLEMRKWIR